MKGRKWTELRLQDTVALGGRTRRTCDDRCTVETEVQYWVNCDARVTIEESTVTIGRLCSC